jgi:hypothetical protein
MNNTFLCKCGLDDLSNVTTHLEKCIYPELNIENKNMFVKCSRCRIYLHSHCAYSYCIQISEKKCPHCQRNNSLYYYNDENCHLL